MVTKKEVVSPPKKATLKEASVDLKKGSGVGGRVLAEESVAKKQDRENHEQCI